MSSQAFADVPTAIEEIRAGRMIVVVDDEDRENEGDLTMAASAVTPESINFMVTRGRGLVCLAMTPERLDELEVPLEVSDNSSRRETARKAVRNLENANVRVLGAVLNHRTFPVPEAIYRKL